MNIKNQIIAQDLIEAFQIIIGDKYNLSSDFCHEIYVRGRKIKIYYDTCFRQLVISFFDDEKNNIIDVLICSTYDSYVLIVSRGNSIYYEVDMKNIIDRDFSFYDFNDEIVDIIVEKLSDKGFCYIYSRAKSARKIK